MDKLTKLLKEVYQVNIDFCKQEVAMAEKLDDKDFLARAKKNLQEWQAKLDELDQ